MKINKLTPGSNLIWESSRMMIPEHVEAILQYRKEQKRKPRPRVDEQAFEEYARLIQESLHRGRIITITVYDPFEDVTVTGQVQQIDPQQQRIRFIHGSGKTYIPFEDIMNVER